MAYKNPLDPRNKEARKRWYYRNREQEIAKAKEKKRKEKLAKEELFPSPTGEMAIISASKPEVVCSIQALGAKSGTVSKARLQLGMSSGKARNMLFKDIMFSLVQSLSRDTCYRCEEKIRSVNEFSIDHKIDWLDNDPNLYWDLDNIAFSHLSCNSGAGRKVGGRGKPSRFRKEGPEGTSWCYGHKAYLPLIEFTKNKNIWNGVERLCKVCRRKIRDRAREL